MTCSDHLLRQDLGLGSKRPQAEADSHVPHIPALAEHHDAHDGLDAVLRQVDVAGGLAGPVQVFLGDDALSVGVDDQDLRGLEPELLGPLEVLADAVCLHGVLRHDEEHRPHAHLLVGLVVGLPPPDSRVDPEAVLLDSVVPRHVVGVSSRIARVVLQAHVQRGLDYAVLHRLGERVVADDPGVVHAVLVLGRGREVQP